MLSIRRREVILDSRRVKTPGGNVHYLYEKKQVATPKCGDCGSSLSGPFHHRMRLLCCPQMRARKANFHFKFRIRRGGR